MMDTRSSSSSSSAPVQGQQSEQHPTYTTVGSVYNPQTTAPLQPPARRGRALRWPPTVPVDMASFQKSGLAGFSNRGCRSPPTTASTLRHYSPLQQNQERAINPFSGSLGQKRSISRSSNTTSPVVMHLSSFSSSIGPSDNEDNQPGVEVFGRDDEIKDDEEDEELARMSNYSVKTLTSLAQIPNPHQKIAQRALDKARESFKASTELSRPITPILPRQGFDGAGVLPSMSKLFRDGTDYTSGRIARHSHMSSSTRSSVLSSGPGAPQPLTAGPPGQRQYKASTLEGPFRALQASAQKTLPSEVEEAHFDISQTSSLTFGTQSMAKLPPTHPQTPEQQQKSLPQGNGLGSSKSPIRNSVAPVSRNPSTRSEVKYHDTETLEYLKQYYPLGPPPRYNPELSTAVPIDVRSLQVLSLPLMSEEQERRDIRHKMAFYAGARGVFKSFDERYDDFRKKVRDRQLGLRDSNQRAASRQLEIDAALKLTELAEPNDVSIEAVSQFPTHEAAELLLGMAFSTLARYWDNGRLTGIPTGFDQIEKQPDRSQKYDPWTHSRGIDSFN